MTNLAVAAAAAAGELRIHILGAGSGVPTAERDTSGLLVMSSSGLTLVDCPGSIVSKLATLGIDARAVRRLILTHDHVDHLYGLPHLLQAQAINGSTASLALHAPRQTLETVRALCAAVRVDGGRYPPLDMIEVPLDEGTEVIAEPGLRVVASPTAHSRDTVALRFESGGLVVCHSSDTKPSATVTRLARGADVLLHDCGGPHRLAAAFITSHSSARQAGQVAREAEAGRLVLMHLSGSTQDWLDECRHEAAAAFGGLVELAFDGMLIASPARSGEVA